MKTVSFGIANYCVPCHAHCRYCLLAYNGRATGAAYGEGEAFAHRVLPELSEKIPAVSGYYYVGYCMDTPDLFGYIRFSREHRSPGATFLQMNGFAFRSEPELLTLMNGIRENGVELIDLTFYGTEAYHDRFAGRKGDFAYLRNMLAAAYRAGLPVNVSIPLLSDNLDQMTELRRILSAVHTGKYMYFLPHGKGRGRSIRSLRITREQFESLPEEIRNSFQKTKHLTEAEWLASGEIKDPEKRDLVLVLTPENLPHFRKMPAEDILKELESLDDRYLREMPPAKELAERYGNPGNRQLYKLRDLLLEWQQRYLSDTGNTLYDMHDETHHFSVHL